MKNKKALLPLDEGIKILLAIMGVFLLGLFIVGAIKIFTESTALGQAKGSLEKISSEIEKVQNSDGTGEFFLESPKGWWVTAWPQEGEESPAQCRTKYCICIYEDKYTDAKKTFCKDVPPEFKIKENLGYPLIRVNPLASLKIYKDGENIILEGGVNINEKPAL